MNWCVHAQCPQFLAVHSAVLARGDAALILPAPSGSGKSTLCAALAFRGWRLLSDELALIDPASGQVLPLPRPISLKNQSVGVLRAFAPEAVFGPVVPDTLKGSVCHLRPPPGTVAAGTLAATPRWLVFPRYTAGAPARLTVMPKAEAFMALMGQAFNVDGHGREGFALLGDLVDRSRCLGFSYGDLDEAVALFDREFRP
jgi:HprK-related kinase A